MWAKSANTCAMIAMIYGILLESQREVDAHVECFTHNSGDNEKIIQS